MIILVRHRRMSNDPAIDFPIGDRQQRFEQIKAMFVEARQMLLGKSAEDEIEFPKATPLRAKQCFPAPDVDTVVHGPCYSASRIGLERSDPSIAQMADNADGCTLQPDSCKLARNEQRGTPCVSA